MRQEERGVGWGEGRREDRQEAGVGGREKESREQDPRGASPAPHPTPRAEKPPEFRDVGYRCIGLYTLSQSPFLMI